MLHDQAIEFTARTSLLARPVGSWLTDTRAPRGQCSSPRLSPLHPASSRKAFLAIPRNTRRTRWAAFLLPALLLTPITRAEPAEAPPQPEPARPALSTATDFSGRRAQFLGTITAEARERGIPPDLADAVATVESAYDPGATGRDGEVGLMQILPSTATMLGFRGTDAALAEPETNIRYAVAYLARAWELADGNLCRALMKYRAGHGEERMSPLSITYCRRAIAHLASMGSPLARGPGAALPPVTVGNAVRSPGIDRVGLTSSERARLRKGQRTTADIRRYEAAQEARVRALISRRPVGNRPGVVRRPAKARNAPPGDT